MKIEIKQNVSPIAPLLAAFAEYGLPDREVYIEGKRCPDWLEHLILKELDGKMNKYVSELKE